MTNSLSEKVVMVTGGNTGIGYGIVDAVAALRPACIYLCARNKAKADTAIAALTAAHPSARIEFLQLDLVDLSSVRACAERFDKLSDRLDLLFLNAGISARSPGVTADGYEIQFGVNYLGHMLLTQLLMPKLLNTLRTVEAADVRVVAVSSISSLKFTPPNGLALEQMKTPAADLHAMVRYGHSKLAQRMAARKLAQLYSGILFVSLCPGNVKTDIWHQTDGLGWFTSNVLAPLLLYVTGVGVDEAVRLPLWCATCPRGDGDDAIQSGSFYQSTPGKRTDDSKYANDQELCDRLWDWTETELSSHGGPGWATAP